MGPGRHWAAAVTASSRVSRRQRSGNPLPRDELAGFLDHFKDEPIPSALRVILQHELRGNRKRKPRPKPLRTAVDHIEDTLFPLYYTKGLSIGEKLRTWLKQRQKKQRQHRCEGELDLTRQWQEFLAITDRMPVVPARCAPLCPTSIRREGPGTAVSELRVRGRGHSLSPGAGADTACHPCDGTL